MSRQSRGFVAALCGLCLAVQAGTAASSLRILGGRLAVEGGAVGASQLEVAADAELRGNGTLQAGTVQVAGRVSPGTAQSPVGTLTISGDVAFQGGEFACHAAGDTNLDTLVAAGSVYGQGTVAMSGAAGANPQYATIIAGGAQSVYSSLAVTPADAWRLVAQPGGRLSVCAVAAPGKPVMEVLGANGMIIVSGSPATAEQGTDFGRTQVLARVTHAFSVSNTGTETLSLTGATLTGAGAAQFSVSLGTEGGIAAGGVRAFTIVFRPTSVGLHTAAVAIANNSQTTPYVLNLSGEGRAVEPDDPPLAVPTNDYDGDGRSDLAVFDPTSGCWYMLRADGTLIAWQQAWGWVGAWPVPGDYDGDGTSDLAVFDSNTGAWYVMAMNGTVILWQQAWGWPGAEPVSGDYNGDRTSDLCVFDPNSGAWYARGVEGTVLVWAAAWGWPGAEPVPGDYNGDGVFDLCVFDPNSGAWYAQGVEGTVLAWAVPWGWPGAEPVSGDYNGDSICDLAVFDPNSGAWYIRSLDGAVIVWNQAWGWPGAEPVGAW